MRTFPSRLAPLGLAFPLLLLACGASKDVSGGTFSDDSGVGTGDGDIIPPGDSSNPFGDIGDPFGDTGTGPGEVSIGDGCAGSSTTAQLTPLDLYLMIDRSGSMTELTGAAATGPSKWDTLKSALGSFLADPSASGLGVGEAFFAYETPGVPQTCIQDNECNVAGSTGTCEDKFCYSKTKGFQTTTDPVSGQMFVVPCTTGGTACKTGYTCQQGGSCDAAPYVCISDNDCIDAIGEDFGPCDPGGVCSNLVSCSVADYSKPTVAIATLPGNKAALNGAISSTTPEGDTPTGPALQGAVQYAEGYQKANPTHKVVVVLATDGVPTDCTPQDIPSIANIASTAKAAGVPTYVIGIYTNLDASLDSLNAISQAGNGDNAIIINASASGNASAALIAALNKIRGAALSCQYQVPTGAGEDYNKVNVNFTPASGTPTTIPYVGTASACTGTGGWYYDVDPSKGTPTQILVCPTTCTQFSGGGTGAKVDIVVGCQTIGIH